MNHHPEMESRLQVLINGNRPENRKRFAEEWKNSGKKIIGLLCIYVPEEILAAAGVLPWRITGTWREAIPLASAYRPGMTCRYCSHVLESVLQGELEFLDGLITTQVDDDFKRLWDVLHFLGKPPFTHILYLPHKATQTTRQMWRKSIDELRETLESWLGVKIPGEELRSQIATYNQARDLLKKVYELRKKEFPPLTGAEALGLTTAARVMPKEKFNQILGDLLPYLENRKTDLRQTRPRLLMSGEYLDNPGYVKLVEEVGGLVVMDDFDTGSKYFWERVPDREDVWGALADRYIHRPGTARMAHWKEQADQILQWVKEFKVDGVVELRQLYSLPLDYRFFILQKIFARANIPYLSLSREYHLSHLGMLRTRVEAFVEMVRGRVKAA